MKLSLFLLLIALSPSAFSQEDTLPEVRLQEVVIRAFEQNRRIREVPAAVALVGPAELRRFAPLSLVSAVNTQAGVRMEERSPGSYRFNIRGSSLRSPFGVRNIKVYWNEIPFTDPGGQTYLNSLSFHNIQSIEIIKGPGSSIYGAGTGGVLLLDGSSQAEEAGVSAGYTGGSYGLQSAWATLTGDGGGSKLVVHHQENDGYRQQSQLRRDVLSWSSRLVQTEKSSLRASFLYSDLFYGTPGALTAAEFAANPRAARPGSGAFPGSAAARATVSQQTFLAGAVYSNQLTPSLQNRTSLYGAYNKLENPNIRGYDKSKEPHTGLRTVFHWKRENERTRWSLNLGGEWQQGFAEYQSHKNVGGNPDSLRFTDDVRNRQSFVFAQASLEKGSWQFTGGASWNILKLHFTRFNPATSGAQNRSFRNEVAPRFSLSHNWKNLTLYTSVAKGFSPPTTSELLPTGGSINTGLEAEQGINYDLGLRGNPAPALYIDVNAFYFRLENSIVQRRDAGGGDFYTNSGRTRQLGLETSARYSFLRNAAFVQQSVFWASHTLSRFRYRSFRQVNTDFSGNRLPGIPGNSLATGMDLTLKNGLFLAVQYLFNSRTPLNDANTAFAEDVHLAGLKLAYTKRWQDRLSLQLYAGGDNLLDREYSLGQDINAFGGRYYNAAPGRNYYVGLSVTLLKRKEAAAVPNP